jgi:hypothetical protein
VPGDSARPDLPRDRNLLTTSQRRTETVLGGVILAVAAIAAVVAVSTAGSSAPARTTTTSSTTTSSTTTTTAPPPPPPVYPLTGKRVTDQAVADRPALVVKIDNAEPRSRPQIGLYEADVVYEERVEGSVTRFLAIFHSGDAVPVGPVRSGRTSDIGLFKPLGQPLFAWSGSNTIFQERIRAAGIADIGYPNAPGLYHRDGNRPAPHNLMLDGTPDAWNAGAGGTGIPHQFFAYRDRGESIRGGKSVRGVRIVFGTGSGSAPVEFVWDGDVKGWARSQAGTPHVDALGRRIAPENVIVQYTRYAPSDTNDGFGVPIREAQLVGEGEALVLTGGQAIAARWRKPALGKPTRYLDSAGKPIELTPGRTWVELPEPGTTVFI